MVGTGTTGNNAKSFSGIFNGGKIVTTNGTTCCGGFVGYTSDHQE